jgi:hypothetical protein
MYDNKRIIELEFGIKIDNNEMTGKINKIDITKHINLIFVFLNVKNL